MSREDYMDLLDEIERSGGETDKMKELLQKLRDDFDDRQGQLKERDEVTDKETPGTEKEDEKIEEESIEDNKEDGGERRNPIDWESKYKELIGKLDNYMNGYRERKEESNFNAEKRRIEDLFK